MMSKLLLAGAAFAALVAGSGDNLGDSVALIQSHVGAAQMPTLPSKEEVVKMAKEYGKKALKDAIRDKTPFGLGKMIVNDKDKTAVKECGDISSSLYCSMSEKVYGIKCRGWGGASCLDEAAGCTDIVVQGICQSAIHRLNISCLGWGGSHCLPYGAKAGLITDERLCKGAEARLGIRSVGWSGQECLDKETATCDKIGLPGVCNSASTRLGLDCAGWGGSSCLSKEEGSPCSRITSRHICQSAKERFGKACTWAIGGHCADATA